MLQWISLEVDLVLFTFAGLELSLPSVELTSLSGSDGSRTAAASPELRPPTTRAAAAFRDQSPRAGGALSASSNPPVTATVVVTDDLGQKLCRREKVDEEPGKNQMSAGANSLSADTSSSTQIQVSGVDASTSHASGMQVLGTNAGSGYSVPSELVPPTATPIAGSSGNIQQQKFSSGTFLSPGIPGLLPPLISSTPCVGGPMSRIHVHYRSFSENNIIVAKQGEEGHASHAPFRPWEQGTSENLSRSFTQDQTKPATSTEPGQSKPQELATPGQQNLCHNIPSNVPPLKPKGKKGRLGGASLRTYRTSSLTTAQMLGASPLDPQLSVMPRSHPAPPPPPYEELDPLRKAMVQQQIRVVQDLSWLQQHRPGDPTVFGVCREYTMQVEQLERLRLQALALASPTLEAFTAVHSHYDQQRLELLRLVAHNVASIKATSFHLAYSYQIPDVPMLSRPAYQPYHSLPDSVLYPQPTSCTTRTVLQSKAHKSLRSARRSLDSPGDSAYSSQPNSSSSSDASNTSSGSDENAKLVEQINKVSPLHTPYANAELKTKDGGADGAAVNNKENRLLNRQAVWQMEAWYNLHFDHPYPTDAEAEELARRGGISVPQVRKWMSNKRARSYNTLSFNGSIHPRRMRRLQQQQQQMQQQQQELATGHNHANMWRSSVRFNPMGGVLPRM